MGDDDTNQSEASSDKRRGSHRRLNTDRRSNVAPWTGIERRAGNRRIAFHRRELPHGVSYETADSIDLLYDWLRENCHGEWVVNPEQGAGDQTGKSVQVQFEQEPDRDRFMQEVGGGESE